MASLFWRMNNQDVRLILDFSHVMKPVGKIALAMRVANLLTAEGGWIMTYLV